MKTLIILSLCLGLLLMGGFLGRANDEVLPITVKVWSLSNDKEPDTKESLSRHRKDVTAVAFSPDGTILATASLDQTIWLWENGASEKLEDVEGNKTPVTSIAFSPTGRFLASGYADGTIKVWRIRSNELPLKLSEHKASVTSLAFSSNGRFLVSGSSDKTVKLWETSANYKSRPVPASVGEVNCVSFSPDNRILAIAGSDKEIKLWDLITNKLARSLKGHLAAVNALAFNSEDKTLASGGDDGTVRIWNTNAEKAIKVLTGHASSVTSVAFAKGGTLASGGWDATVRLWSTDTYEVKHIIRAHEYRVTSIAFTPDGQSLATATVFPDQLDSASLFIVSVGFGSYQSPHEIPLAATNAQDVADAFEREGKRLYKRIHKQVFLDAQGNADAILSAFKTIAAEDKAQDCLVFYYSGHCSVIDSGQGKEEIYLATTSITDLKDETALSERGIPATELQQRMAALEARKQLLLFDNPEIGKVDNQFFEGLKSAARAMLPLDSQGPLRPARLTNRDLYMMTLIAEDEKSALTPIEGHTPFTHFLLKGLSGAAERSSDSSVMTHELDSYLNDQLGALTDAQLKLVSRKSGRYFAVSSLVPRWRGDEVDIAGSSLIKPSVRRGKSYALMIATDIYDDDLWDVLKTPVSDAREIATLLKEDYGFEEPEIWSNKKSTEIWDKLVEYSEKKFNNEDWLFIFFAGHGAYSKTPIEEGYIVAKESKHGDPRHKEYIRYTELRALLDNMPCDHIFVVLDVCYAGKFNPDITRDGSLLLIEAGLETASPQQIVERVMPNKTRRFLASGEERVKDGTSNSPFARAFITLLKLNKFKGNQILTAKEIATTLDRLPVRPVPGHFGGDKPLGDFIFFTR